MSLLGAGPPTFTDIEARQVKVNWPKPADPTGVTGYQLEKATENKTVASNSGGKKGKKKKKSTV